MLAPRRLVMSSALCAMLLSAALPGYALAQGRGGGRGGDERGRAEPRPPVQLRAQVFIGGYFYDPVFGRYPWWLPGAYPHRYFPVYERRAEIRVMVTPREAAVYVDGFYAGIVDDFDGFFQRLPVTPGTHDIELYLDGYRTERHYVYVGPRSTLKLRATLERLPPGVASERPSLAPPVPPPPPGSYRQPRTAPPLTPPPASATPPSPAHAEGFGTLELQVQPAGAQVTIDGQLWQSSDGRRFVIEVSAGRHHVEASLEGYRRFSTDVEIREGEITPLNVSLTKGEHPLR